LAYNLHNIMQIFIKELKVREEVRHPIKASSDLIKTAEQHKTESLNHEWEVMQ